MLSFTPSHITQCSDIIFLCDDKVNDFFEVVCMVTVRALSLSISWAYCYIIIMFGTSFW